MPSDHDDPRPLTPDELNEWHEWADAAKGLHADHPMRRLLATVDVAVLDADLQRESFMAADAARERAEAELVAKAVDGAEVEARAERAEAELDEARRTADALADALAAARVALFDAQTRAERAEQQLAAPHSREGEHDET